MNDLYMHACTCDRDALGIKKIMGASDRSNQIFNSCSEGAKKSRMDAENKRDDEAAKRESKYIKDMRKE